MVTPIGQCCSLEAREPKIRVVGLPQGTTPAEGGTTPPDPASQLTVAGRAIQTEGTSASVSRDRAGQPRAAAHRAMGGRKGNRRALTNRPAAAEGSTTGLDPDATKRSASRTSQMGSTHAVTAVWRRRSSEFLHPTGNYAQLPDSVGDKPHTATDWRQRRYPS